MHSLGGLVTKKALSLSESSFEEYLKEMDRCTIAIAFLGTPHRGSDVSFPKIFVNVLRAAGKQGNNKILRLFDRESDDLENVSKDFAQWVKKKEKDGFKLKCFYEEFGTGNWGQVGACYCPYGFSKLY